MHVTGADEDQGVGRDRLDDTGAVMSGDAIFDPKHLVEFVVVVGVRILPNQQIIAVHCQPRLHGRCFRPMQVEHLHSLGTLATDVTNSTGSRSWFEVGHQPLSFCCEEFAHHDEALRAFVFRRKNHQALVWTLLKHHAYSCSSGAINEGVTPIGIPRVPAADRRGEPVGVGRSGRDGGLRTDGFPGYGPSPRPLNGNPSGTVVEPHLYKKVPGVVGTPLQVPSAASNMLFGWKSVLAERSLFHQGM
jgi:hypothetical protein